MSAKEILKLTIILVLFFGFLLMWCSQYFYKQKYFTLKKEHEKDDVDIKKGKTVNVHYKVIIKSEIDNKIEEIETSFERVLENVVTYNDVLNKLFDETKNYKAWKNYNKETNQYEIWYGKLHKIIVTKIENNFKEKEVEEVC